jgi:cell division septal protein FtsQ
MTRAFVSKRQRSTGRNPKILVATQKESPSIYLPKWIFKWIGLGCLIGFIYYVIFLSDLFIIKQVIIEGPLSENGHAIAENLKGNNIFKVDSILVIKEIKEAFPEALTVKIYRGLPDTLKIQTTQRNSSVLWQADGKVYNVDVNGIAYKAALPGDNSLKISDLSGVQVILGKRVASRNFINFVTIADNKIKEKTDIKPVAWEIAETGLQVTMVTDRGWKVFFDTTKMPENQIEDLRLILNKHKDEIHEYVDLRISGYAFYK